MTSTFQGLFTTKRHARANGINAGGINAGADGNDVGGIVGGIDEDLFGIFSSEVCASLDRLHGSSYPFCECLNGNNSLLSARGGDRMLVTTQRGIEALWFLEKLKLPKHSVNGNKINLRIPEIHQIDCAYLSIVHIKANVFDDFVSFSILSLITYPDRMFLGERKHYFITY